VKFVAIVMALAFNAGAAALGAANLDEYKIEAKRAEAPVRTFLFDNKVLLIFCLTCIGTFPATIIAVYEGTSRRRVRKRLITRYLQLIHGRSFPDEGGMEGGMARTHRVSLFTHVKKRRWRFWKKEPNWPIFRSKHVLACLYRTGGKQTNHVWDLAGEHGLVVAVWNCQAMITSNDDTLTAEDLGVAREAPILAPQPARLKLGRRPSLGVL
jgi:hypothetical protein